MPDQLKQLFWSFCYYGYLLMFLLGTMLINLVAIIIIPFAKQESARSLLRWLSYQLFNLYLVLMKSSGNLVCNRDILRKIDAAEGGLLIIANHPSILDAPIIFSRVRGLLCIFKSSLNKSLWIGKTTKTIGHLSNDGGIDMIRDLSKALQRGEKFLLFPEGTRTVSDTVDRFNPGYALAAIRSNVPVQILKIHSDSPILSKKIPRFSRTRFPVRFLIELGPVIEPGRFRTVKSLNQTVENWYSQRLDQDKPGTLRFLPAIDHQFTSVDASSYQLTVPEDPFYCRGHMPGNPIVPGYVQMAWLRELLQESGEQDLEIRYFRWKFLIPVLPGDKLTISVSSNPGRRNVVLKSGDVAVTKGLFNLLEKATA